eukprot:scaffold64526_cov36-Prasinocladus_malaysianus.AAC.1
MFGRSQEERSSQGIRLSIYCVIRDAVVSTVETYILILQGLVDSDRQNRARRRKIRMKMLEAKE